MRGALRQLFVVHGPAFGGGHAQFVRLRRPLERRGWEVLGAVPEGAPAAQRLRSQGVECVELPLHRLRATADPRVHGRLAASFVPEMRELCRLVRHRGIDLVQAHGVTNPHAALAAHREGRAVVWQLYDTVAPAPLRRAAMPLVVRLADVVTTWGRALGHMHPGADGLGERWVPVYPPVDELEFRVPDSDARAVARRSLGIPQDAFAVALVGNRNPTKGHDDFVRALAELRRSVPGAVGRSIGAPSPAHVAYESGLRDEVRRLGLAPPAYDLLDGGSDVPRLLQAFDVLALPSTRRSEGMPTVILEAMACGLPVVASDVGAVRELVQDGATGCVVPPEEPAELAAALERLASESELRRRMGDAGRARFLDRFSLEALADLHVRAYELALEHRGRR